MKVFVIILIGIFVTHILKILFKYESDPNKLKVGFAYDTKNRVWVIIPKAPNWDNYKGSTNEHLVSVFKRYLNDIHNKNVTESVCKKLIEDKMHMANFGSECHAKWISENK